MNAIRQTLEIIPAVDVLDGSVVRLLKGDYAASTVYGSAPVAAAKGWIDQGAGLVHIVDLGGARSGETTMDLWRSLGEAGVTFQAGGGIRTPEVAAMVLEAGASRVVMGTAAVREPSLLAEVGASVVAAVDVRGDRATGSGWLDDGRDLAEVLEGLAAARVGRLLVTGISQDGTLAGPDFDLTRRVTDDDRFAVIASGGVGTLDDLDSLSDLGCEAVIIGRALYEGRFTLPEALARAVGRERPGEQPFGP